MAMPIISDDEEYYSPTSFKDKLKLSICCFTPIRHHHILHPDYDFDPSNTKPPPARSSQYHLEIKDRCRGFIIGRRSAGGGRNKRGHRSDYFRYDPESYSLNFEEDGANREDDQLPFSSFAARLPATPERFTRIETWAEAPSMQGRVSRTEISGWS